jgi:DNA-binding GntR family transcriptional regulator
VTPHLFQELEELVRAMDNFEASNWYTLNRRFHHALYVASERPFLVGTIDNLIARADPYIRIYFKAHDLEQTQRDHRGILAGVQRDDEDELSEAVAVHLRHVVEGILELIEEA